MTAFELTADHGYVFFVAISYWLVNQILGNLVNVARGKYKIPVGNLYANGAMFLKDGKVDEAAWKARGMAFNQVQRGHQHLFELHSDAYALLLLAAIFYPWSAARAGALYSIGSLLYGLGCKIFVHFFSS